MIFFIFLFSCLGNLSYREKPTELMQAIIDNKEYLQEMIEFLHIDVNEQDPDTGKNALIIAFESNNLKAIQLLLNKGARRDLKDTNNKCFDDMFNEIKTAFDSDYDDEYFMIEKYTKADYKELEKILVDYKKNCIKDFIFVAEIPAFMPFKNLTEGELFKLEFEYFSQKCKFDEKKRKEILELCLKLTTDKLKKYRINKYVNDKKNKDSPENLIRGVVKIYNKDRADTGDVPNLAEDRVRVTSILELFKKEAFGTNEEESKAAFKERLRLVILINRMKSIFSVKNQSLKVSYNQNNSALILRGAWEPMWVNNGQQVELKEVRKYMRACLINKFIFKKGDEYFQEVIRLLGEEDKVASKNVPYHELREHLRINRERERFVSQFFQIRKNVTLYVATHDSDLVRLRIKPDKITEDDEVNETGLYTHYLKMLSNSAQLPDILTTGYRIAYNDEQFKDYDGIKGYAWRYQVVEEERYFKSEAVKIDVRAVCISEPNCLYLCKDLSGRDIVKIWPSFLKLANPKKPTLDLEKNNSYFPSESIAIMFQIYAQKKDKVTVLFDPTHPVVMKIPDRMLKYKNSKTKPDMGRDSEYGNYSLGENRFEIKDIKEVKSIAATMAQSPFSFRDYSIMLYNNLGLCGGEFSTNKAEEANDEEIEEDDDESGDEAEEGVKVKSANSLFTSLTSTIFNHILFDTNIDAKKIFKQLSDKDMKNLDDEKKRIEDEIAEKTKKYGDSEKQFYDLLDTYKDEKKNIEKEKKELHGKMLKKISDENLKLLVSKFDQHDKKVILESQIKNEIRNLKSSFDKELIKLKEKLKKIDGKINASNHQQNKNLLAKFNKLKEKETSDIESLKKLVNEIYKNNIGDILVSLANAMKKVRDLHFKLYFPDPYVDNSDLRRGLLDEIEKVLGKIGIQKRIIEDLLEDKKINNASGNNFNTPVKTTNKKPRTPKTPQSAEKTSDKKVINASEIKENKDNEEQFSKRLDELSLD